MAVSRIPRIILDGDVESASHMAREGIRQLGILKELMGFNNLQQDIRKVEYIDGSRIVCRSCFDEDVVYLYTKKREKKVSKSFYIYVTISDYVTIWDSQTGEVAEGIDDSKGKEITFPCHKDELVKWLEGIPNKPTRQVLKDDPEDNRDYLDDNNEDIGNENRVICMPTTVPWYNVDCFGLDSCYTFLNVVKHEQENTCSTSLPGGDCYWVDLLEKNGSTLPSTTLVNVDIGTGDGEDTAPLLTALFHFPVCKNVEKLPVVTTLNEDGDTMTVNVAANGICSGDCSAGILNMETGAWVTDIIWVSAPKNLESILIAYASYFINSWHQNFTGFQRIWGERVYECFTPGAEKCFLEEYKPRSQHLILCPYSPSGESIGRCHGWTTSNDEVINMICQRASFIYHYAVVGADGYTTYVTFISGIVDTYVTPLEELILDFIPRKKLEEKKSLEDYKSFQETMRDTKNSVYEYTDVINNHINVNSLDANLAEYLTNVAPYLTEEYWPTFSGEGTCSSSSKSLGEPYENDRYAVSWCEYPTMEKTQGEWYKVKLFFYIGKASYTERNGDLIVTSHGGYSCIGEETTEIDYNRFSSVHATIELECPKVYKKENTSVDEKPDWVKKYRRPNDYSGLCRFPGRDCGYPEDKKNGTCYPFDGTYDIFTLGEAVEELINDHYENGSDDQLLVYLYKQSNTISQSTG